jgi:AcrR family transcriptional regulator
VAKGKDKGRDVAGPKPTQKAGASSSSAPRLPAGRHGLPREFIIQNQRERITTALVDTVAEVGYSATTVARITKAASVSRRTFYQHFADKEACFLATYEMVADHVLSSMRAAAGSYGEWAQKVRAALATMLSFFAAEPALARLYMIEPNAAGGEVAARHQATLRGFAELLEECHPAPEGNRSLPKATEETLVGGVASLVIREISAGRAEQLDALLPDMTELVTAPYLGAEAAHLAREGQAEAGGTGGQAA